MKLWIKGGLYGLIAGIISLLVVGYAYLLSYFSGFIYIFNKLVELSDKSKISIALIIIIMNLIVLFITGIIIGLILQIYKHYKNKNKKK